MLRDMEELVVSIKKEHIKEYMKEALNCYNAGSFRGCVIMSTIAAMHDLYEKIATLANSIKEAKELIEDIDQLKKAGKVYERKMVERAGAIGILTNEEQKKILSYLDIRNQCAHPNLHVSTAEEARAVFTGYIDEIISKPALLGPAYINTFTARLENDRFFPNYYRDTIIDTVKEEISKLHHKAIIPIANKTISIIESTKPGSTKWNNAAAFIAGMLVVLAKEEKEDQLKLVSQNFGKLIENESLFDSVLIFTKMLPQVVNYLQPIDRKRYISHLSSFDGQTSSVKIKIVQLLLKNQILNEDETNKLVEKYILEIKNSIKKVSGDTSRSSVENLREWSSIVKELNIQSMDNAYFDTLLELIGDNDYNVVNDAIILLKELDENFIKRMNDKQLFDVVVEIIKQAHGPGRGSDEANKLLSSKFNGLKILSDNFVEYITKNYQQLSYGFKKLIRGEERLLDFLHKTDKHAYLDKVVKLHIDSFDEDAEEIEFTLDYMNRLIKKNYNVPLWNEISETIETFLTEKSNDR
jgi:hypothetical protein